MTNNEDWRGFKRDANRGIRWGIGWYILIVLVILGIGAGIWGLSVVLSEPKGQGDAIIKKNSSENWTAAQARFEDLYAEIEAADRNINVHAETLASDPTNQTYQQTLAGTKAYCNSVIGDYNAEARKFLAEEFRSADLPAEIDTHNPLTDCKENI